jgi:hypothetical protein
MAPSRSLVPWRSFIAGTYETHAAGFQLRRGVFSFQDSVWI